MFQSMREVGEKGGEKRGKVGAGGKGGWEKGRGGNWGTEAKAHTLELVFLFFSPDRVVLDGFKAVPTCDRTAAKYVSPHGWEADTGHVSFSRSL